MWPQEWAGLETQTGLSWGFCFCRLKIVFAALGDTWEFISRETGAAGSFCSNQMRSIFLQQLSSFKAVTQAQGRQLAEQVQPHLGFRGQTPKLFLQISLLRDGVPSHALDTKEASAL